MEYGGGGVLTSPQIITFTFKDTLNTSALDSLGKSLIQSPWFADVSKDYCEGDGGTCITAGPAGKSIAINANAAPLYNDDPGSTNFLPDAGVIIPEFVNQQIAAAITAGHLSAPDANAIYTFYFPPSSTIEFADKTTGVGAASCTAFGGYHASTTYTDGTTPITYAILPDCGDGGTADLNEVTLAASHEVIEATTDPYNGTGWYLDTTSNANSGRDAPWQFTGGYFGEVGDNCVDMSGTGMDEWPLDGGAIVQRTWSTSAAALGHNPCVPVPAGDVYYQTTTDFAIYVATPGVPFTINVSAFSDGTRDSWRLDARDWTYEVASSSTFDTTYLTYDIVGGVNNVDDAGLSDYLCINNGNQVQIQATLVADPSKANPPLQTPLAVGAMVSADPALTQPVVFGGQTYQVFPYHWWVFLVVTPAVAQQFGIPDGGVSSQSPLAREIRQRIFQQVVRGGAQRGSRFAR
jgi:hypothetical protein